MPEHVYLLISEPERAKLSVALQMLKQNVARQLREPEGGSLWQPRYYDFNVWSEAKRIEKLRYIHRNPVRRGLVLSPDQWAWSSFRHYVSGVDGAVEIESQWTARRRELLGMAPHLVLRDQIPRPVSAKNAETRTGHPREVPLLTRSFYSLGVGAGPAFLLSHPRGRLDIGVKIPAPSASLRTFTNE
jgi:hypothetical protein